MVITFKPSCNKYDKKKSVKLVYEQDRNIRYRVVALVSFIYLLSLHF